MLPRPGLQLERWKGHGHGGSAPQPALMALDAATGRVYPVSTLPIHEHTPGIVCFDEINQVWPCMTEIYIQFRCAHCTDG